jgi:hypothetical protein
MLQVRGAIPSEPRPFKKPGNRLNWSSEMLDELDRCIRADTPIPVMAQRCGCHPHAIGNGMRQLIKTRYLGQQNVG